MTFPWDDITWVLLDMDGTLLDKHFDDYFWETLVPEEYARRQAMDLALARDLVFARYQRRKAPSTGPTSISGPGNWSWISRPSRKASATSSRSTRTRRVSSNFCGERRNGWPW